jgi:hypothetical protein
LKMFLLGHVLPPGPVLLAGEDTVTDHPGPKVFGKGRHRDGVRSTHSYTAYCWGHKWVVVSGLVKLPLTTRAWALPVLAALYRPPEWDRVHGTPHRTPAHMARLLLARLMRWFPERHFIFVGDTGYGTSETARFCQQHRQHLTLISKFYGDAALYEPPPPRTRRTIGRPRVKGQKLASPQEVVAHTATCTSLMVAWYGGTTRAIEVVTDTGLWYRIGEDLVAVRWVYVHDATGTHRDEYLFTTDLQMPPHQIVVCYTQRWSIETTFQECREYLKLESTKCYGKETVLRFTPFIWLIYRDCLTLSSAARSAALSLCALMAWQNNCGLLRYDAMCTSGYLAAMVFSNTCDDNGVLKTPDSLQETILYALAPAA